MKKLHWLAGCIIIILASCKKTDLPAETAEAESNHMESRQTDECGESLDFSQIGILDIGGSGAAEISAYDPHTKKLFVVNNSSGNNRIDVLNLSDPATPSFLTSISVAPYGGLVNSVAVSNGRLAAAIEAIDKVSPGKAVVFSTSAYAEIAVRTVGSLPDMVCFSPDGKYILTANEGEPNNDYSIDPMGTVSIIDTRNNYSVTTLNFSGFAPQASYLMARGLRFFGPNASFAQDMEPEYIAVSANSNTAWVTLQENNAIAKIDLRLKKIMAIFPLGFKNFNRLRNAIDPSDQDGTIRFDTTWPVKGIYTPDAIAVHTVGNYPLLYTANEGDAREYSTFTENKRVNNASVVLDPVAFPNGATLKANSKLGRLNITTTLGDTDNDGDLDALYSPGARSFSVWNGNTGFQLYDSENDLDTRCNAAGFYPDSRSDDKGAEPEGIAIGRVGHSNLLFVGMERADAIAIYDLSNPLRPVFRQLLGNSGMTPGTGPGVGPEGILFVPADKSPNGKSLLIVSFEVDGVIKIYSTN
jgi:DNA-binding beta-propeller fold protein YncE